MQYTDYWYYNAYIPFHLNIIHDADYKVISVAPLKYVECCSTILVFMVEGPSKCSHKHRDQIPSHCVLKSSDGMWKLGLE